ncbi:HNH endonuclease signature motif containing protein [Mycoplasma sp. SG1]|uniref:HNH endonuclease signature motif containing protein n=1 Tax=Mycoplasma sp. SG1 TaxID=2810348 RepID=UPI002023EE1B|nr:HNH endonuclease signature motif containing protein [Mycoplasma sp. SG1]URM53171.1 HNH endonuclease [Mycoplasma sp. SG1]
MKIEISINLLKVLISSTNKDHLETYSENDIKQFIYKRLISDSIIRNIKLSEISWIKITQKFQGLYIVDLKKVVYFTQLLGVDNKPKSRNTFVLQNFYPANKFAISKNASISISLNPFDEQEVILFPNFIIMSIKMLLSIGVKINNSLLSHFKNINLFNSIEEFLFERKNLREKNSGNSPTVIEYNRRLNKCTVFGRLDGANYSDTLIVCNLISHFSKKNINSEIEFYNITPFQFKVSRKNWQYELKKMGFLVVDTNNIFKPLINALQKKNITSDEYENILRRNQHLFKANIIKKYIHIKGFDVHKCFASKYYLESNLIGAHIYRYADIKKDFFNKKISAETAAKLIISEDNGFLLSPNCDKEFEKGMLFFDLNKKCFVPNKSKLTTEQYNHLITEIYSNNFTNVTFSDEFVNNVNLHQKRIFNDF